MESVGNANVGGTENTFNVNAVVFIKTLVLNSDKGMGQIFRDHVQRDRNTVGILGNQFCCLISFQIVDESGKTGGCDLDVFNTGSGIYDTLKDAEAHADADNAGSQDTQQGKIQYR